VLNLSQESIKIKKRGTDSGRNQRVNEAEPFGKRESGRTRKKEMVSAR